MIPATLRKFIQGLRDATDGRDIEWHEGASDNYFCDHKGYALHFQYYFNADIGQSTYYFKIKQKDKAASFSVSDDEDDFSLMNSLWSSVGVNAAGFDNIADDFFS